MSDELTDVQIRQIETAVRKAIREELADAGLRIDDGEHQDEAREDFRFLRRLRKGLDGAAAKVGWTIMLALIGGLLWIVNAGLNVWRGQ